jgi:hypothetical protein
VPLSPRSPGPLRIALATLGKCALALTVFTVIFG